jgi:hypothetical protein
MTVKRHQVFLEPELSFTSAYEGAVIQGTRGSHPIGEGATKMVFKVRILILPARNLEIFILGWSSSTPGSRAERAETGSGEFN